MSRRECFPRESLAMDTPRSEFKEIPNHLLGFTQVMMKSLFSSSVIILSFSCQAISCRCGGSMKQFSQCLIPAPSPDKIPNL